MAALLPIRLVLGDDEFLAERAADEYVAAVRNELPASDPEAVVNRVTGSEVTAGSFGTLISPNLFGGAVIAVVASAQDADKGAIAAILDYARRPAPGVYLAICHNGGNKGKALPEGLKKLDVEVVKAAKIKRQPDRVAFVRGELRAAGASPRSASAEIADTIIQAVGSDLRELASACSQLVADTEGNITVDGVARYYSGRAEVTGFTVADATVAGNPGEALGALRWAMQIGVDPVPIADALAMAVRNLSRVAAERGGSKQLAAQLGMAPWQIDKARRQSRNWTADSLAEAMRVCARLNGEVKGGSDDRAWALEHAVLEITRLSGADPYRRAPVRSGEPGGRV
ncbi:DNA polymerase III subunit delta [Glycomyces xiaoerkulensis]|uniref:DNA polymerase III subunit delta n=1 Tax=Glycomyces xiaoerkulensis TaxID=2038139 RepID=UPI0018E430A0|nr:DNA polymerase III subunit delta [Glycomyces xiaoerkulensis]